MNVNKKEKIETQVKKIFEDNECMHIYEHSVNVAKQAQSIAKQYHMPDEKVYLAGLLHDIGGIYPNEKRVDMARQFHIELFDEEIQFPLIIHQKLSKYLAQHEFGIDDEIVLSSIECHTTLKENYTQEDLIVFLADKIAWDQKGEPPYLKELLQSMNSSLEEASLYYIEYILSHNIKVIHPWLAKARLSLKQNIKNT